jgi:hypothetical protein
LVYGPKWFKNRVRFQSIDKSIQIPPSREIQILDPYLLGIYFFPQTRCKEGLVSQISSKSEVPRFSKEIPLNFNP